MSGQCAHNPGHCGVKQSRPPGPATTIFTRLKHTHTHTHTHTHRHRHTHRHTHTDTQTHRHTLSAWVSSQPAVGGEVPPQLLSLGLCERLKRWSTGAAVETKPLHRLLEGGNSQLPGHLATKSSNQSPYTPNRKLQCGFKALSIKTLKIRHVYCLWSMSGRWATFRLCGTF